MPEILRRATRALNPTERERLVAGWDDAADYVEDLRGSRDVGLETIDGLMADFDRRKASGGWSTDRAVSDRWLAPRLHWALRLFRSEAADREMWLWLGLRYSDYVRWRWSGKSDQEIPEDRWCGPIHKQALSRLWWGGELFRDGSDYRPVTRAFVRQDLPNSYLHRPIVRCRSVALAILGVVAPEARETEISSDQVNDLARTLNLATAGAPPEAATGFQADDMAGYQRWVLDKGMVEQTWDSLPVGPGCLDTTESSVSGGRVLVDRAWSFANPSST